MVLTLFLQHGQGNVEFILCLLFGIKNEGVFVLQMIAMQTGKKLRELPDDISKLTYQQTQDALEYYANAHFEGIKAVLLQKDPGFLNQ